MNEREYRMFEYGSLILGWLATIEWVMFCIIYDIPLKGPNAFAFILVGIASMLASLLIRIKHHFFVQEMKEEIEKHRGDEPRENGQ